MELWHETAGSSTSYMFNCSQRDIPSFRKLTAQWSKKTPLPTDSKRRRALNICTYIPNHVFSSHRIILDELYTQCICSVLKQAPELSMPSLWHTRCYQSPSSATGIALLGGTSLVPRGSWFVRCLQRHTALTDMIEANLVASAAPWLFTVLLFTSNISLD